MAKYVLSDPHFGHKSMAVRRSFASVEEMDALMIERWNGVVGKNDKVYLLGDFCLNRRALPIAGQLNGRKILIKGNHDNFRLKEYAEYFADVRAYQEFQGGILSHIPIHEQQKSRYRFNIHGHLHLIMIDDPFYINVSAENVGYYPQLLEALTSQIM